MHNFSTAPGALISALNQGLVTERIQGKGAGED